MNDSLNIKIIKCEPHNWLYDEFEEPCPLCEAVTAERERIIKLLEADAGACNDRRPMNEHIDEWCNCRLIALIKGENK